MGGGAAILSPGVRQGNPIVRFLSFVEEGGAAKFGVEAALGKEFAVCPLLHHFAEVENKDAVGMAHGAEAVGDDEGGAVHHETFKSLLDESLGFRVHAGGSLVEQ